MLQILSKTLKLACRRHATLGIIWNKESYLSVGQFVSETHSCCGRFLPVQPRIWLFFSVEKASPPNFMQWEEGKKRKKWTEQEMMTQLYGNHFRTKTGDREPMTTSTLVQISGWKDVGVLWNSVQIQTCALNTKKKKKKKLSELVCGGRMLTSFLLLWTLILSDIFRQQIQSRNQV